MRSKTIFFAFVLASMMLLLGAASTFAQYKGLPVKKDKLISVIRSRQLQTREIVSTINTNGVDFKVDPIVEAELRGAGARPEVIEAARSNYRAAVVAPPPVQPGKNSPGAPAHSFSGSPMSKDAIITLLNNGVADAQVKNNVATRGVNFKATAADKAEIKGAGGSQALVSQIEKSYNNPNENAAAANDTGGGSGQYDTLVDKAVYQYDVLKDVNGSIASLRQAISLNPNEARGYQLMGFSYLYGMKNFAEAEKYMRLAIERGGSAVFRVFHDHGLSMESCEGSLFIAKDTVRFESDNNIHTFETNDDNIKETKMAGGFAQAFNTRSGLFKISLKQGDKSKNFNFAPLTNDAAESKMIIRLIDKKAS